MNLKLVKFKLLDSQFLYNLRNSFEIRIASINKKKISLKEHTKWILSLKKNRNLNIHIINYYSKKIGYIRTLKSKKNILISIALKKKYRNQGIGAKSLTIFEKKTKLKNLAVYVLKNNLKSLYFFFSCNYYIEGEKKNFFIMKKNSNKNKSNRLINDIESVRKKNNTNWMDILRIAFKYSPKETAKIMSKIYSEDSKISRLSKKLKKQI